MTSNKKDYSELIPDYLHGLLASDIREDFERELSSSITLQEELEDFKSFQTLYQEIEQDSLEPSEEIFRKITDSIDNIEKAEQKSLEKPSHPELLAAKVADFWHWLKDASSLPWGVAIAQAAVIAILIIPGPTPQVTYNTLSGSPETAVTDDRLTFNIVFKENTTESEIRKLLLAMNGNIVSGPSAQGRYMMATPAANSAETILTSLKESDIIVFVETAYRH